MNECENIDYLDDILADVEQQYALGKQMKNKKACARDYCIVMMIGWGFDLETIVSLKYRDFKVKKRILSYYIYGKKVTRSLTQGEVDKILRYRMYCKDDEGMEGFLFPSQKGGKLNTASVQTSLRTKWLSVACNTLFVSDLRQMALLRLLKEGVSFENLLKSTLISDSMLVRLFHEYIGA